MSTILVVDDMPVFREPIAACLQSHGYEVQCASNGKEALELIRHNLPDLVLLDIGMPVMDGLALLEIIVADPWLKKLPVILLTAIAEKDHVLRAAKLGIRDYMLKSRFSLKELLGRIAARLPGDGESTSTPTERSGQESHTPPKSPGGQSTRGEPPATAGTSARPAVTHPKAAAVRITGAIVPGSGLADLQRVITPAEIEKKLRTCEEICAVSPAAQNTLKLASNAGCSVEEVARSIKQDQGLALKVLKLANSVTYSRGTPVDSVDTAVQRIGMSQIRQMVLSIGVVDRFSTSMRSTRLDPMKFWEHSIGCGLIAGELMRCAGGKNDEVDAAFTMSLLHDTGRAVLAEQFGEIYENVLATAEQLQSPVELVESRMLGTNHAEVMHHIFQRWQFGQHLAGPIANHHHSVARLREVAGKSATASAVLVLADRLTHALVIGSSGNDTIYPTHELVEWLKLSTESIAAIALNACDQTNELKFVLLSRSQNASWPDTRKEVASKLRMGVRPLFVGEELPADPYRMFFSVLSELSVPDSSQPPNLIVAHLSRPRIRAKLGDMVKTAESESHVSLLPILAISPEGAAELDAQTVAGRRCESVRSPATVKCLIEASTRLLETAKAKESQTQTRVDSVAA